MNERAARLVHGLADALARTVVDSTSPLILPLIISASIMAEIVILAV